MKLWRALRTSTSLEGKLQQTQCDGSESGTASVAGSVAASEDSGQQSYTGSARGLDKALCPSIGNLRGRLGSRYEEEDSSDVCACSKVTRVTVEREAGCLGITVRGGVQAGAPAALVITSVHPGGPADREGSIRPGDRLLAVDGTNLQSADLSTAHAALRGQRAHQGHQGHQPDKVAVLTIEYSVCVVGAVVGAQGPLLVELARPPAHQLGLTLGTSRATRGTPRSVVVEDIKPASVADRSGALHRGDHILAVDDVRVDGTDLTPADVTVLLAGPPGGQPGGSLRLEVLPAHCVPRGSPLGSPLGPSLQYVHHQRSPCSPCPSESGLSAYNVLRSLRGYDNGSIGSSAGGSSGPHAGSARPAGAAGPAGPAGPTGLVSHSEVLTVLLRPEPLWGYGLAVRASGAARIPTVSALHPDGPAERTGCLQIGDRIVAVDDREVDAEQLALLLDNPGPPVALRVSFSVAESVVPASGVFTVKLAKCRPGLGITITGNRTGEFLYISDIKCGSVAHRSGTLSVGDRLLEIDGLSLNTGGGGSGGSGGGSGGSRDLSRALDDAARILHACGDVVTLKVLKEETPSELGSNWSGWGLRGDWLNSWPRSIEYPMDPVEYSAEFPVEYTVELVRHGGPLGLTIAGSEDPTDSVTISGLTAGGLAEQTGALHVGDRLLAINGECLRGRRLSEAITLFQNSSDVVTLKIARSRKTQRGQQGQQGARRGLGAVDKSEPLVDSAVESWDSSPSQHNASSSSPALPGLPLAPLAVDGADGRGRVKLTPLPPSQPAAPAVSAPAAAPSGTGQPLSRRAGSCPSLDCLLQNEAGPNHSPEWDGSLEDLDSAAATAAHLSMRGPAKEDEGDVPPSPRPCPPISPPASFRQGASSAGPLWPRPPPSPSLTAAKALTKDWQERQRQQRSDVDNLAASPKLSSFQWTNNKLHNDSASNSSSFRNFDYFSEMNNNRQRGQGSRNFDFDEQRTSSLLLEEVADDVYRDLGLQHPLDLYQVTIFKDSVYEDFGFSVSDGLYERGVFINRIRKGGPADASGVLQPYDRILQVNETRTHDFDCCLTVPLIAAAGDNIQLIVARNPNSEQMHTSLTNEVFLPQSLRSDYQDNSYLQQDSMYERPSSNSYQNSNTVTQTI